jgi:pimeloyl-ACP methyl ester carboxylesterase
MSPSLEDVPYPHPVSYMSFTMSGQDVRMAYMDVSPVGAENGKTVVLLHGGNFFAEYWKGTIEVLRNEGFRVLATDRIGYGRSSKPILPYTLHDMALHIKLLLDEKGISKAAIVGHSMGGMVTSRFAFSYPSMTTHAVMVNQIGLTDSRLDRAWRDHEAQYQASLNRTYDSIRRGIERYFVTWNPDYEYFIRLHYGWTQSGDWPQFAMVRSRISQMLYADPVVHDWPHIKAKTLVIGGTEDGPNFPALAKNVADTIPNAELVLIDNVGHIPHLEAPDQFHAELIRFLKSDPVPERNDTGRP